MGLKEDLMEMKKEFKEVKEQSLAMELLQDSKKANVRICRAFTIVLVFVSLMWGITIVYLIHTLNDIGVQETTTTQELNDINTINGNIVNNGDINGENKASN